MFWKRALIVALGAIAVISFKVHQKRSVQNKLERQVLALCAADRECDHNVKLYFADCFENSYEYGHRLRRAGLNYPQFLQCLKRQSGRAYFEVKAD